MGDLTGEELDLATGAWNPLWLPRLPISIWDAHMLGTHRAQMSMSSVSCVSTFLLREMDAAPATTCAKPQAEGDDAEANGLSLMVKESESLSVIEHIPEIVDGEDVAVIDPDMAQLEADLEWAENVEKSINATGNAVRRAQR